MEIEAKGLCFHEVNIKLGYGRRPSFVPFHHLCRMPESPDYCPRCTTTFLCQPENITKCQCYGISISDAEKAFIAQQFNNCLCHKCLEETKKECLEMG